MPTYEDFDIKIVQRQRGEYSVSVIKSPAGEASGTFVLPFSETELKEFEQIGSTGLLRGAGLTARRAISPELTGLQGSGSKLFNALFKDIKSRYEASCEAVRREKKRLRIKLRLDPTLVNLPWEFMYDVDQGDFVILSTMITFVRYTELPQRLAPLEVSPPLHILVVLASPRGYPPLDSEQEKEKIASALGELQERGVVEIEFLEGRDTLSNLRQRLRTTNFHVLHFIGHGNYEEATKEGFLLMEDGDGKRDLVSGRDLARMLRGHFSMRLVVLNACEGAQTSGSEPFAGVATAIVRAGVPAVIAMRFKVSDETAINFAREFYLSLAANYPIDAAVAEARIAIAHVNTVEWSALVLYMRAPDGMIFNLHEQERKRKPAKLARRIFAVMVVILMLVIGGIGAVVLFQSGSPRSPVANCRVEALVWETADQERRLWIGTEDGVYVYNTREDKLEANYLAGHRVRSIAIDGSGNKWFGAESGVIPVLCADGEWEPQNEWCNRPCVDGNREPQNKCGNKPVASIVVDRDDRKWFATAGGGISMFDGNEWRNNYATAYLESDYVPAMTLDSKTNELWFSTSEGKVSVLDASTLLWGHYNTQECDCELAGMSVGYDIAVDYDGNKWLAGLKGVIRFNEKEEREKRWQAYTTANSDLASNQVKSIAVDRDGRKWFGTDLGVSVLDNGGAFGRDDDDWKTFTTADSDLEDNHVLVILCDDATGSIWLGTAGGKIQKCWLEASGEVGEVALSCWPARSVLSRCGGE